MWLYFSGGGVRAGLGALGAVYFLTTEWAGEKTWQKVRRISSVSGGSLENASLLTAQGRLGAHFGHTFSRYITHGIQWFLALLIAMVALAIPLVILLFSWPLSANFWPLRYLLFVLRVVVSIIVPLAWVQLFATLYTLGRMWWVIEAPPELVKNSPRKALDEIPATQRMHVFATAEAQTGQPSHIMQYDNDQIVAADLRVSDNQVYFLQAKRFTPLLANYASSVWPLLHYPYYVRNVRRTVPGTDLDHLKLNQVPAGPTEMSSLILLDGGLTGTLASRLDNVLAGAPDTAGRAPMEVVDAPGDSGTDSASLRRVIVDAGQHSKMSGKRVLIPGLGGIFSTMLAIKVSLDSQITLDRVLATGQAPVWMFPITGGERHFDYSLRQLSTSPFTPFARVKTSHLGRGEILTDQTTWSNDDIFLSAIVKALQKEADKIGNLKGYNKHGLACAASGVAGGFEEAQGIGGNLSQFLATLRSFEMAVLQRGGLDPLFDATSIGLFGYPPARTFYRWPELDQLHRWDLPGQPHRPFAIAHQGDTGGVRRPNSYDAFKSAFDKGCTNFECDVQVTKDEILVALHASRGWVKSHNSPLRRRVHKMDFADLKIFLDRPTDIPTVPELLDGQGPAGQTGWLPHEVVWNLEAKHKPAMDALLEHLNDRRAQGTYTIQAPIISGGWRQSMIALARQNDPNELTAVGWREGIRLFRRKPVPHAAVVQLPTSMWKPIDRLVAWITGRIASAAVAQRMQVHWYNTNKVGQMDNVIQFANGGSTRQGASTDNLDELLPKL